MSDQYDDKAAELLPCLWSAYGGNPLSMKRGLCCECATCSRRPAFATELRRMAENKKWIWNYTGFIAPVHNISCLIQIQFLIDNLFAHTLRSGFDTKSKMEQTG